MGKIAKISKQVNTFIGSNKLYHLCDVLFCKYVKGFSAKDYFFYELYKKSRYERKKYMTNRQSNRFEHEKNDSAKIDVLVDKYQFDKLFYKYVNRDFIYMKHATLEEFRVFCSKHSEFIVKKNWLCEGLGIYKCVLSSDNEINEFYQSNKDYILIEEPIIQHSELSEFHPQSVNTLRVTTLLHNDKAHVISAALRIGTGDNCTDNLHNAGIACAIDLESGTVISKGYDKNSYTYSKHPDSSKTIVGFKIPHWEKVLSMVTEAALLIPDLKWIGWDVAITENGCVLVEGNTIQGVDLIQVGQDGLWPKIEKVYMT